MRRIIRFTHVLLPACRNPSPANQAIGTQLNWKNSAAAIGVEKTMCLSRFVVLGAMLDRCVQGSTSSEHTFRRPEPNSRPNETVAVAVQQGTKYFRRTKIDRRVMKCHFTILISTTMMRWSASGKITAYCKLMSMRRKRLCGR